MPRDRSNPKKLASKLERLKILIGVDMCACAPMNALKCHGECRADHTNEMGNVVCGELYQIDTSIFRTKKKWNKKGRDDDEDQFNSDTSRKRGKKRERTRQDRR